MQTRTVPSETPRLNLLGTAHWSEAGRRFDLPDTLPGYLLAYLALRADWVSRESLAPLCWPDATEEEAQHNLRVNLTRLRPLLREWGIEAALTAERRRLRLSVATDVAELRALRASAQWSAAAALPNGPLLKDMSFRAFPVLGEWARTERDALLGEWRDALLKAADRAAPAARLDFASRYLDVDAFDEEVLRVQLGVLADLGRVDDVRRRFAEFDARSRADIGIGATESLAAYAQRLTAPGSTEFARPAAAELEDPLVGRDEELETTAWLVMQGPLVTITGLGGIGKTRLARAAQTRLSSQFANGVLWLSLIDLSGVAEIARRLADALQVTLAGGREPVEQLCMAIGDRHLLVVLDNAEHLLGERLALCALITDLLQHCLNLKLLVTSREPLRHPREQVLRLEGLGVPDAAAGQVALGAPAVQLFVHLARRVRPTFDPRGAVDELTQIARLVGGLPLALRIASAWLRLLTCADVAAEIRRGLDGLEAGAAADASVRATLARTWQRLSVAEKSALSQLSVFVGPFSAQAAREVAGAHLPILDDLAYRCLLIPSDSRADGDRARFELHPMVRAFAAEQLASNRPLQEQASERHALHVTRVLAPWSDFRRVDQKKALMAISQLLEEALAAWRWSLGAGRADLIAEMTAPLSSYFEQKGWWDEAVALFADAERQFDSERRVELAALAAVGRARAVMLYRKGEHAAAEEVARGALAWARSIDHRAGIKGCLNTLALSLEMQGRYTEALVPIAEALEFAKSDGDRAGEAVFTANEALLRKMLGDFFGAEMGWRRALAIHREVGNWRSVANVLNNLGNLLRLLRRYDEALVLLDEGLRICDEYGFASTRSYFLINLAQVHADAGRLEPAMTFAELALEDVRRSGERKIETASHLVLGVLALLRADMALAARHLHAGLQLARATGDMGNLLEALDGYARWCEAQGRAATALAVRLTVIEHPKLHGELRGAIEERWNSDPPAPELKAAAAREAPNADVLTLTERALVELGGSLGPPPRQDDARATG